MMLHASELSFIHPITGKMIIIEAVLQPEFVNCLNVLGFTSSI